MELTMTLLFKAFGGDCLPVCIVLKAGTAWVILPGYIAHGVKYKEIQFPIGSLKISLLFLNLCNLYPSHTNLYLLGINCFLILYIPGKVTWSIHKIPSTYIETKQRASISLQVVGFIPLLILLLPSPLPMPFGIVKISRGDFTWGAIQG